MKNKIMITASCVLFTTALIGCNKTPKNPTEVDLTTPVATTEKSEETKEQTSIPSTESSDADEKLIKRK